MLLGRSGSGRFWGGSDDKQPQQPPAPPPLPGTTLVLEEPKSKARVYIVGCVHGARASEEDVAAVIEGRDAGVVVLVSGVGRSVGSWWLIDRSTAYLFTKGTDKTTP